MLSGRVLPYMEEKGRSEGTGPFLVAGRVHCVNRARNNSLAGEREMRWLEDWTMRSVG